MSAALLLPALLGAAHAAPPAVGDLVFTEILADAGCQYNEWFELYNTSGSAVDLDGCDIVFENPDSASITDHTVSGPAEVAAGSYGVFFRSSGGCGDATGVDATGSVPVVYEYGSIQLTNAGERHLRIECGGEVIDSVSFDGGAFACDDDTYGSCSMQLDPASAPDATTNDDATVDGGAWCSSNVADTYQDNTPVDDDPPGPYTALGTPAAPNQCGDGGVSGGDDGGSGSGDEGGDDGGDDGDVVVPADVCVEGDVVISELMIAPRDGANADEWIEVTASGGGCNLHSCVIETWVGDEPSPRDTDVINASDESLQLIPGEQLVLARGTSADRDAGGIVWTDQDGDDVSAAYLYDYGVYLRSDPGEVRIVCDGETVDSAPIDWDRFTDLTGACPDGWCSVNLHPGYIDPTANDDLSNWCVPPMDGNLTTHTDPNGETWQFGSTVGKPNECPSFDWPGAGEAAFIELMGTPQGTEEWFELYNGTGAELELTLCTLRRTKFEYDDETGEYGPSSTSDWLIGEDGVEVRVPAGEAQLFAKGGCLIPETAVGDTGDAESAASDCSLGEVIYGSVSFTSDGDEQFELVCPTDEGGEVVVDSIQFNLAALGIREGHSLQLDKSVLDDAAAANDNEDNWCEAAFSQEFYKADVEDCNYGTPGEIGECLTDPLNPPAPVCRCSSTSWRGMWVAWVLPLLVLVRRRQGPSA